MKRLLVPLLLLLFVALIVLRGQSPTGIAGPWRMASVVPDGTADGAIRDFFLELKENGTSVSGTVTGAPMEIRDGRIDGKTVTLNGVSGNQAFSLTGELAGDEIVFKATGLLPEP